MTARQKKLLNQIKKEVKAGYKGMNEFEETLEDSSICTVHFDNINALIYELMKEV